MPLCSKTRRLKTRLAAFALSAAVLAACGGSGETVTPGVAQDVTAPVLSFSPSALTVASGGTGTSEFSATDNIAIRTGPTISCTDGGAFADATFTAPTVTAETVSVCTATATDPSGNTGTATLTVTISAPNQAPSAQATANKSVISEGQPFTLDASNSSDPEGAALTYSWSQIEGPAVDLSGVSGAVLDLDAPLLSEDATLVFEVTVTDGEDESRESVSIDVEALDTLTIAGWAPPNTGGVFTSQIAGITTPANGGFRTHWGINSLFSFRSWSASQLFDDGLEPIGPESRITQRPTEEPDIGRLTRAVQSGERTYYIHQTLYVPRTVSPSEEDSVRRFGFSVLSQRPESDGDSIGAIIADGPETGMFPTQIAASAYSDERIVTAIKITGPDQPTKVDGFILAPDGTQVQTTLVEPTMDRVGSVAVTQSGDTSYLAVWSQGTTEPQVSPLLGRHVTADGTQSENIITISDPLGLSSSPAMTTLSDGRILVVWNEAIDFPASQTSAIQGRFLRPDGTAESDVFMLFTQEQSEDLMGTITAEPMDDGEALLTWWSHDIETVEGNPQVQGVKIQALAVSTDGVPASNVFEIYNQDREPGGDALLEIDDMHTAVSTDNRAVIGWNFSSVDPAENSFYSDFYPVGR